MTAVANGPAGLKRNVLMLYDRNSVHINTVREHLEAFALYSRHNIFYAHASAKVPLHFDLDLFDAVAVHYSVRVAFGNHMSPAFQQALAVFKGPKLLLIQDEYDNTDVTSHWINEVDARVVFTCVPPAYIPKVYAKVPVDRIDFVQVLTGYVPFYFETNQFSRPLAERALRLGYRGRALPFRYGNLGREKVLIGERMKQICAERGVAHDIEWTEEHRLYGMQWLNFLSSCRGMLGTESGSNVLERDGSLTARIEAALAREPGLPYDQIFERYLKDRDGEIVMNQISPKVFEAIALRTALVLFEGGYSNVIAPDVHYIPLKKDFSNVGEVLAKLEDLAYLERITERAYADVIASGNYSYRTLAWLFDEALERQPAPPPKNIRLTASVICFRSSLDDYLLRDGSIYSMPFNDAKIDGLSLSLNGVLEDLAVRLETSERMVQLLRKDIRKMKRSWTWRAGRAVLGPVMGVKKVVKRLAGGNDGPQSPRPLVGAGA
jgi:hypothetical protein